MAPHPNNISAAASTRKRFSRAKSTSLRIICWSPLLLHGVLEYESVRYHPIAGRNAAHNLLHVVGQHVPGGHFLAAEAAVSERRVNPLAIMQVKNGAGRHGGALFQGVA